MKPKRSRQVAGMIIGSLLLVGSPIVAFLLHAAGMMGAFDSLGADNLDPQRLSGDINMVLYAWPVGVAGSLIGLVVLIVSIVLFARSIPAPQKS